jgi:hypothetical protein
MSTALLVDCIIEFSRLTRMGPARADDGFREGLNPSYALHQVMRRCHAAVRQVFLSSVRSWNLADAAPPPACAAAAAPATATAATAATPSSTATATTATAASANNDGGFLHADTNVFPIEEMERGESDVGHFLFA